MQQTRYHFAYLLDRNRRCCKNRCAVDTFLSDGDHSVNVLIHQKGEVKDDLPTSSNLWDKSHWGDFEILRVQPSDILPEHNLAEPRRDLVGNVFLEQVMGVGGACRGVWAPFNCCFNNVPRPVRTTVHLDAVLPLGWAPPLRRPLNVAQMR